MKNITTTSTTTNGNMQNKRNAIRFAWESDIVSSMWDKLCSVMNANPCSNANLSRLPFVCTRENCVCVSSFRIGERVIKTAKMVMCVVVGFWITSFASVMRMSLSIEYSRSRAWMKQLVLLMMLALFARPHSLTVWISSKSKRKIVDTTQLRYISFRCLLRCPVLTIVALHCGECKSNAAQCACCSLAHLCSYYPVVAAAHTHWTRSRRAKQNRKNDTANGHTHMREQQHRHGHRGNDGNVIYIVHNTVEFNQRTRCVSQSIDFLSFCHVI